MESWGVALLLMVIAFAVVAGIPGSPLRGRNRIIFGAASVLIVLGYVLLAQGPADNPLSLTWAPILLVIGYVILIPISLLRRQDDGTESSE